MAAAHNSDQVVEDYKSALQDLTANNKHEINFLTMIAKEYMSKAVELSRELENHIGRVPPERKLPALYVLDSIAKNVGGAYIHCLSQNLFHTFMSAYSLSPPHIRKKLDEMFKTWKEPVPGSTDLRPVFPAERTRPIETTLIKFRTIAAQQQQRQQGPPMSPYHIANPLYQMATPQPQWQNTGTPPQSNGLYGPPNVQGYPQLNGYPQVCHILAAGTSQLTNAQRPPYPQYNQPPQHPQPTPPAYQLPYQPPTPYAPQPPPLEDLASLHRDIEDLISTTKHEFAARHWDTQLQTKLKALLDLQSIMRSQQLPPIQIQAVRNQVSQLAQTSQPAPLLPPASMPLPNPVPTPVPSTYPAPPPSSSQPSADLQSLINSNALADILASAARANQNTPVPSVSPSAPPPQYPPEPTSQAPSNPAPTSSSSTTSLLANLQALGMLAPSSSAPNGTIPAPQSSSLYSTSQQINSNTPPLQAANPARPLLAEVPNDVELTNASLKIPRPHLVKVKLFDARPNQCSTCGQRFLATEEGRSKKARHLDWHFRTNQRLADSAKRIQSRSWYVDEMDWIKSRDNLDDEGSSSNDAPSLQAKAAAEAAKNDPKNKSIPVPSDPALSSAPCPICQEKFEPSWDDESQDFVWRDAVKIQNRVYHASCHAEIKKDGASTPLRTGTPDSVLGKRKAGAPDLNPSRSKLTKSPALSTATIAATTA
ncbi:MAG: hypothetical protein LQ338_003620 [Usnochroma carphineum]|nr:MAG: hypothetical protein LQ338_003620 [Usnochroma carphineum]